jgi:putative transcriptional regulator
MVNLDRMTTKRQMSLNELSEKIKLILTFQYLIVKVKVVCLSPLEVICEALECQPREIFEWWEA